MVDFISVALTGLWKFGYRSFFFLLFQNNLFIYLFYQRSIYKECFTLPKTTDLQSPKSPFRRAADDACESSCLGCCDFVVLQGLLSIAELGKKEGDLGASVSLPTLRN